MNRLAMGIDFSTLAIHVTYGAGDHYQLPYRLVHPLDTLDPEDRCTEVASWLNRLLAQIENQYDGLEFTLMCIERPWMGKNVRTVINLTQIQAACIVTCQLRGWFVVQEDPNKIRKKVLGVGTVQEKGGIKKLAQQHCRDKWGMEFDGDTADSMVIWEYARWLAENANLTKASA